MSSKALAAGSVAQETWKRNTGGYRHAAHEGVIARKAFELNQ